MGICVVVPVYNVEKYLPQCIESLINQTRKIDQIILVDDGSTDKCSYLCDQYAERYLNIDVVHKKNAGLGMARNTGIEYCNQHYISFFDSDDFADCDYIEQLMAPIDVGFDTCKSSYRQVNMDGEFVKNESVIPGTFELEQVKEELLPRLIGSAPNNKDSIPMSSCSTVYSVSIIQTNKLRFVSERNWISEDTIFNIEYYSFAKKVRIIDYIGYNYRVNPKSLTKKYMPDRFDMCKKMYLEEKRVLEEMNLYSVCRFRLDRQYFNYLRMCFKQISSKNTSLTFSYKLKYIDSICSDTLTRFILSRYPIDLLDSKQKIFLYIVKYKFKWLIYISYDILKLD